MTDENPFFAASVDPIKQNPCYVAQCEKGFALFSRITLDQNIKVGVMSYSDQTTYRWVEGNLDELSMYEAVIDGQTIPVHQINRVVLLEEQNPFM